MLYGIIGYYEPYSIYPNGYHCTPTDPLPFANLASQKNHIAFCGMGIYIDEAQAKWFVEEWEKTGKKLNMCKSCVRFKKLDDVPLDVIGKAIKRIPVKQYIALYEKHLKANSAGKKVSKNRSATKSNNRLTKRLAKGVRCGRAWCVRFPLLLCFPLKNGFQFARFRYNSCPARRLLNGIATQS